MISAWARGARPRVARGVGWSLRRGDAWERDYVTALLDAADGNVSLAARRAGMDRAYLHCILRKHGAG